MTIDPVDDGRDFLQTRRARITPEQAGITPFGGARRVPGLRREEVAMLAGVSVDYYTRLEKGNLKTASDQVLDAVADALQLDDAERTHLFDLARASRAAAPRTPRAAARPRVPESILRVLESMLTSAAMLTNGRLDVLAANPLATALYQPMFDSPTRSGGLPNLARFRFLDPASRDFYPRWQESAETPVAILRYQAGRDPRDKALSNLIGELSTRSEEFRTLWASHDVRVHAHGVKYLYHPLVGEMQLDFDAFTMDADQSLRLSAYTARPDSRDAENLALLASFSQQPACRGSGSTSRASARSQRPAVRSRPAQTALPDSQIPTP